MSSFFGNLASYILGYMLRVPYSIAPKVILSVNSDYMIDSLAKAEADFSISHIIGKGISSQNLSVDEVKKLAVVGCELSKLDSAFLTKIIKKFDIEGIKLLSQAGADFSQLDKYSIIEIIDKFGIEVIKPLSKTKAGFFTLDGDSIEYVVILN